MAGAGAIRCARAAPAAAYPTSSNPPVTDSPGRGHCPAACPNAPVGLDIRPRRHLAACVAVSGGDRPGIAFVAVAQFLFADKLAPQLTTGQRLTAGSLVTLAGMVLFGLAAVPPDPALSTFGRRMRGLLPVAPVLTNRWSLAWLAIGWVATPLPWVGLKAAGEAAVVWAWLIGIAALLISQWPSVSRSNVRVLPAERVYLLALAGLMVLALVMRAYRLTTLPLDLDGDFASHGFKHAH